MKNVLIIFLILAFPTARAGGFVFPNVSYSYAKLYLFNIKLERPSGMDYHIYKDGLYASSKIGNGIQLDKTFHTSLQEIFKRGIDELYMGLSKCYMPRHGIIYYNEKNEPVASLSICFECEKISIWSKNPYQFSEDYESFDYDKAENQIKRLRTLFKKKKFPLTDASDKQKAYAAIVNSNPIYKNFGVQLFTDHPTLKAFKPLISLEDVKNWCLGKEDGKFTEMPISTGTSDGDLFPSTLVKYKDYASFIFMEKENAQRLTKATIINPHFKLPNGTAVGMSLDELCKKIGISNELKNQPEQIVIQGKEWLIVYTFTHQTLTKIVLSVQEI